MIVIGSARRIRKGARSNEGQEQRERAIEERSLRGEERKRKEMERCAIGYSGWAWMDSVGFGE